MPTPDLTDLPSAAAAGTPSTSTWVAPNSCTCDVPSLASGFLHVTGDPPAEQVHPTGVGKVKSESHTPSSGGRQVNVPVSQPPGTRFRGVCHMVLRAPQQDERPRPQSNPMRTDTLCFPSPSPFLTCASWDHLQINHLHPPVCVSESTWGDPTQDLWCVWTIILGCALHKDAGRVVPRLWAFRQSRGKSQAQRPPCGLSALRWAQLLHFVPSGGWVSRTHTVLPCSRLEQIFP